MQVTDLETSKKLKDIMKGHVTRIHWGRTRYNIDEPWRDWSMYHGIAHPMDTPLYQYVRAYTLTDILSELPKVITWKDGQEYELAMISNNVQMAFGYKRGRDCFFPWEKDSPKFSKTTIDNFNPVQAAAKLLIWVKNEFTGGEDE